MKVETYDGRIDRQILAGMVMDKTVLGALSAKWDKSKPPFASREMNLLGEMAVQHYMKYKKAPGRDIVGHFDRWAQNGADPDTVRLAERILSSVSTEYEQGTPLTSAYLLDLADQRFNAVRAKELRDMIDADLESGDVAKCLSRIESFRPLSVSATRGVSVMADRPAIKSSFERQGDVVMSWGQKALDDFFGSSLERDGFVVFEGREKVGKSFWLQELMWQAGVVGGKNVAFFEVGDQSESQIIRRIAARAAGRPYKANSLVRIPTAIDTGTNPAEVDHDIKSWDAPMTWPEADTAFKAASRMGSKDRIKLSVHPNSSVSVIGIEVILDGWARDGWVPDVVVIDYADILSPIDGRAETRDQINATWKALRRLSQQYHCLVATATQADAASYDAKMLSMKNFSEDKRKHSHVTGMVGINQGDKEKEKGIYRLNWIVGRDLEFSTDRCVYTAACLPLANPAVLSSF